MVESYRFLLYSGQVVRCHRKVNVAPTWAWFGGPEAQGELSRPHKYRKTAQLEEKMSPYNGKSISRSLVGTVLSVGAFFSTPLDNSQSVIMLRSLQVFMRWEKPSSRWKTTWHLELVGSPLKPSALWRKAHTTAPHSHPGAGERWRNSTWHRNVAVVTILRQKHQDNWREKHQPIQFWKLLTGAASLVAAGNRDTYTKNASGVISAFWWELFIS